MSESKKVLLHMCCGPCSTYPVPELWNEGFELHGYFYNPNIHPYTEYQKRENGVREFADQSDLPVFYDQEYQPLKYFQAICYREKQRCLLCYQLRLNRAAQIAKHGHFDFFTTTLLVSPFQKHHLLRELGEAIGEKYRVPFLYRDFREGFGETVVRSKAMGLYRQQYCGCLYSEIERYAPANIRELVK